MASMVSYATVYASKNSLNKAQRLILLLLRSTQAMEPKPKETHGAHFPTLWVYTKRHSCFGQNPTARDSGFLLPVWSSTCGRVCVLGGILAMSLLLFSGTNSFLITIGFQWKLHDQSKPRNKLQHISTVTYDNSFYEMV